MWDICIKSGQIKSGNIVSSLEIWALKPRFLFIFKNMLKGIATSGSECTAK